MDFWDVVLIFVMVCSAVVSFPMSVAARERRKKEEEELQRSEELWERYDKIQEQIILAEMGEVEELGQEIRRPQKPVLRLVPKEPDFKG